jgi:hypothetical protein
MRLPLRSRPLLTFIRGTTFTSSGVISRAPSGQSSATTTRQGRSLPARPRLRALHGGASHRHRPFSRRVVVETEAADIESDAAVIAPSASGVALIVPAPAAAGTTSDKVLKSRAWGLALPSIGEQLLSLGVGLSDTFLSGHLSDQAVHTLGYGRATAFWRFSASPALPRGSC